LSEFDRGQIIAYMDQGMSATEIGKKVGRDRSTISRFMKNPLHYGTTKRPGRPRTLDDRSVRRVLKASSSGMLSANQIRTEQRIPLTTRSVQNIIAASPHMKYEKRKMHPKLDLKHVSARLSWAESKISWTKEWQRIIFSDEKKFNLDGPDGWQYYWHDLRKEPQSFSKRVQGGGSVMVWAAFGYKGKSELAFMTGRKNAAAYQRVLEEYLLPCGQPIGGNSWQFQQDNAPIHTAGTTKQWLLQHNIRALQWPSRSPDLNPIENVWGSLARRVYDSGRQYDSIDALKAAIKIAWQQIGMPELQNLVNSMPKRIVQLLKKNGKSIPY
jgi:transposase